MGNRHLLHVRSNQVTNNEPKLPGEGDIRYGELAINYAKGNETISLKNSDNEIVSFNIGKSIKGVKVNNVNATIANNIASVTISGSNENVGTYTSVQYPTEFSAATNVSGSQTIAEAFNSVETTISALTKEMIKDEKAISESIIQIAESAGLENENEISYVADTNAHYISGATTLYDADKILDSAIYNVATSTQNSLSGVNVNGVNATVSNNKASVVISGSDANVGTYTSVEYPSDFSAATNVSGSQTIAEAFNSVENTVSALTQIVFDDEFAIEKISKSIAEAAGTIDSNNEIKYNVNENAHYISGATSLANADDILDAKVAEIDSAMDDMLYAGAESVKGGAAAKASSMPTGVIDSTSTATEYTATVDDITELRPGVFCYLMNVNSPAPTTATTLNINGLGAKPLYASMSANTHSTVFSSGRTMMFVYNTTRVATGCWDVYYGYQYYSDTDTIGYQIRRNAGAFIAKNAVYRYKILFQSSEREVIPASTNNITSTAATPTRVINSESFNPFGAILAWISTATTSANGTVTATNAWDQYQVDLRYSFNMSAMLTGNQDVYVKCQPVTENGKTTGRVTLAADPLTQTLPSTEDGLLYLQLGRSSGSSYSIILQIHHPIYYYKDGGLRLWTNQTETDISGKADINHTHVSSGVTIEEDYQEISYPQSFSGATNVESGQTVTEAFQNVETTISALTQELINDELINAKAISALGSAAGTIDENSTIKYEPNENAKYISAATTLYEADSLLDAAISNIESSSQNYISGTNVNGVSGTVTDKVANVVISGSDTNVGTYTSVEYPTEFSAATNVSGSQTIAQAFNAVETTISALTKEMIDDEKTISESIIQLADATGLENNDEISYVADTTANYISGATSLYNADSLLDSAIYNIASSSQNSISGVSVNGVSGTVTDKVASVVISGHNINVGNYESVTYPESFTSATNVSGSQTVAQALNSVENTISALTQEVLKDELVTQKSIVALSNAAGTVDENENIAYVANENANYINVATSLSDADDILDSALSTKADKVKVINHGTTGTTFTLPPNEMHVWGSVSTLTLNLETPTDNTIVNEYLFSFTSPLSATTLSLPASVKWVFELVVEPEKTYTISIVDNLATYLTEDMSIIGADESVLAQKEDISNKVNTIDQNSSDTQYPSAKCVYDYIEARLLQLNP